MIAERSAWTGAIHPFPDASVLDQVRDKVRLVETAAAAGVATPETLFYGPARELHSPALPFPVVVKPARPVSSLKTAQPGARRATAGDATGVGARRRVLLVQERLHGPLVSVELVLDREGSIAARFQHVTRRTWPAAAGSIALATSVEPDEGSSIARRRCSRGLGYWGLAQVDFVDTPVRPRPARREPALLSLPAARDRVRHQPARAVARGHGRAVGRAAAAPTGRASHTAGWRRTSRRRRAARPGDCSPAPPDRTPGPRGQPATRCPACCSSGRRSRAACCACSACAVARGDSPSAQACAPSFIAARSTAAPGMGGAFPGGPRCDPLLLGGLGARLVAALVRRPPPLDRDRPRRRPAGRAGAAGPARRGPFRVLAELGRPPGNYWNVLAVPDAARRSRGGGAAIGAHAPANGTRCCSAGCRSAPGWRRRSGARGCACARAGPRRIRAWSCPARSRSTCSRCRASAARTCGATCAASTTAGSRCAT